MCTHNVIVNKRKLLSELLSSLLDCPYCKLFRLANTKAQKEETKQSFQLSNEKPMSNIRCKDILFTWIAIVLVDDTFFKHLCFIEIESFASRTMLSLKNLQYSLERTVTKKQLLQNSLNT